MASGNPNASPNVLETDWIETEEAHIFKFNVPGLKKQDVVVQMIEETNTLQVKGAFEKNLVADNDWCTKWHIRERPSLSFCRKFQLPRNINSKWITATDDAGVLTVTVPKKRVIIRDIPISML